ncbi:protein TIFY 8 [Dorcoceras hygrometricum]|uniref:Protein TIFY n=1 Tax=Dorcoceras hygrometricum TaxID=472368 RepID=A0A2Z7D2X7_9LAMI|nr:protein TIFY 8 [Dorcoceras hygrometricum]
MAHAQSNSKNTEANGNISAGGGDSEVKSATFHDFLGNKGKRQESASAAGGGGSRPPPDVSASATSEQASERHVNNHLEGIPYYGSRGELMGPETSYRFSGNKRSNSDSFMVSRDKLPHGQPDSQDNPVLTKLLRYSGGEQPRQPHDEETFGPHQLMPIPSTFISQSSHGGRTDVNNPKWDRAIPGNLGLGSQYPPRSGQVAALGYQALSSKVRDTNMGTSVVSQTAADEGSRTGIKGSGILSSINTVGGISGRQPSGVLIRRGEQKSGICVSEPETSVSPSQRGTESSGRQMTIFYGGQAHVFDNIHPNKADVIMALAGSNGGSWSTAYTSNLAGRPSTGENQPGGSENDLAISILRELQGRSSEDAYRGFSSGNQHILIQSVYLLAL